MRRSLVKMDDTCAKPVHGGVADPVITRLVADIETGVLKPGQWIGTEVQLAEAHGISRMTLRRALSRLVENGLIDRRPGKGLFVRASGKHLVVDCFVPSLAHEQWIKVMRGAHLTDGAPSPRLRIHDAHGRTETYVGYLHQLIDSDTDGAIIGWLPHPGFAEEIYRLKQAKFPFVLVDASLQHLPVPSVRADHRGGGYAVGQALIKLGHRRIAFVGDPQIETLRMRLNGLRDAIADGGLPFHRDLVADLQISDPLADWSEAITRVTRELMSRQDRPTAIFYANDSTAALGCRVIKEMGFAIPADVSVVGFDDDALCELLVPPLATVAQPAEALGREAIRMLIKQIEGRRSGENSGVAPQRVLPVEWIARGSIGPPRKANRS